MKKNWFNIGKKFKKIDERIGYNYISGKSKKLTNAGMKSLRKLSRRQGQEMTFFAGYFKY